MSFRVVDGLSNQLISVLLNSFSVIFAKIALRDLSQWQFIAIYAAASVMLAVPFVRMGQFWTFLTSPHGWLAITTGGGGAMLFYSGLEVLDPATHSFIVRSYVVYGLLISWLVLGERFTPETVAASMVCVVGTMLAAWPENADFGHWTAVFLTLAAAGLFAVNYAALRHLSDRITAFVPIVVTNAGLFLGITLSHPDSISLFVGGFPAAFSILAAASLAASTYFFMLGSKRTSFWLATTMRAASPVFVLALSLPLFEIHMSSTNAVGAGLTVLSVAALGFYRAPRRAS